MAEIDNYEDSSAQASDDVESSKEKTMEMRRVVEIPEILEMRMMIPCPCQFGKRNLWFGYMTFFLILIVHPYLTPTVRETKQNYMTTLKPYTDKVKDTIIDTLKANLKGVTIVTSAVENENDEILGDNNSNQPCENSISSGQKNKDDNLSVDEDYTTPTIDKDGVAVDVDEIIPLAIVDEYFTEEVNEQVEEKMAEKDEEKEEEKLKENEEEKKEKLEEKKQEENEEEKIKEKKEEEEKIEEKEKEEEQIGEKEEEEKE
uniref:Chromosome 18 open reading frame 34 n=1 Tax=Solanum tuberosum TaxID=4113 RepID=M1D9H9_SOLTU